MACDDAIIPLQTRIDTAADEAETSPAVRRLHPCPRPAAPVRGQAGIRIFVGFAVKRG